MEKSLLREMLGRRRELSYLGSGGLMPGSTIVLFSSKPIPNGYDTFPTDYKIRITHLKL